MQEGSILGHQAEIGVFGGSGFYEFVENLTETKIETPYGLTSDRVAIGEVGGRSVAFLPRHGREHQLPPHAINYRANVWAMKSLGVKRIVSPTAAGSLQAHIKPGEFVLVDQFIDRTTGRKDTFYDGPITTHISSAEPYCPQLREHGVKCARELDIPCHDGGTVVVIQGPRFSTRAESQWFTSTGWQVINMTQYPEMMLARELEMCYQAIALITDFDAGIVAEGEAEPVSVAAFLEIFAANVDNAKRLCETMVRTMPEERTCECGCALSTARLD